MDRGIINGLQYSSGRVKNLKLIADSDYTADFYDDIIAYSALSAMRTVNLPDSLMFPGRVFTIKDACGGAGGTNITINPEGGTLIDGAASFAINVNYGSIDVFSDGTNWFIT